MSENAEMEWMQAFMQDAFSVVKKTSFYKRFLVKVSADENLMNLLDDYYELVYE